MQKYGDGSMWEPGFGGDWNVPQSVGETSLADDDDFSIFIMWA